MTTAGDPSDTPTDMSPRAIRARRDIEARPLAWWGMMLTIAVTATTYGAMYFSYVWLRIGVTRWPPEGIDRPALGVPALAVAALLASGVVLWLGLRGSHRGAVGTERAGLAGALALAGAHVGLLIVEWSRAEFSVDVHAYASLFYVLPAIHAVTLGTAMLFAATVLAMSFRSDEMPRRGVALRSLGAFWYFLVIGGALLLAVVYLMPYVWPVA